MEQDLGSEFGLTGAVNLEADRSQTMGDLRPIVAAANGARLSVMELQVVNERGELAAVRVTTSGPPLPLDGELVPEPGAATDRADGLATLVLEEPEPSGSPPLDLLGVAGADGVHINGQLVEEPQDLSRRLREIKQRHPGERAWTLFVHDAMTLQELVTWLDAARGDEASHEPLFPVVALEFGQPDETTPEVIGE